MSVTDDGWNGIPHHINSTVENLVARARRQTASITNNMTYQHHIQQDITRRLQRAKTAKEERLEDGTKLLAMVESRCCKGFVMVLVVANMFTMGFEADNPTWIGWGVIEQIFVSAFVLEAIIKLIALKWIYFDDNYNCLDFSLALLGVTDTWLFALLNIKETSLRTLSVLRTLRLFRLVRVLRLIKGSEQLRMVIQGVADAVSCTFWVGLVMLLAVYVGSIFCMAFLGGDNARHFPGFSKQQEDIDRLEIMTEFNPYVYFGTMTNTFLTLFSVAFLATWTDVVVPIFWVEPFFILFFAGFFLFMFGLLNVIIGLIVDKVLNNARRLEEERHMSEQNHRLQLLDKIRGLVSKVDNNGNGIISSDELEQHILDEKAELHEVLHHSELHLPIGCTAEEMMLMLDADNTAELEVDKFLQSFFRLLDSTDFQRNCMLQMGLTSVKHCITNSQKVLEERLNQLEARSSVLLSCPDMSDAKTGIGMESVHSVVEAAVECALERLLVIRPNENGASLLAMPAFGPDARGEAKLAMPAFGPDARGEAKLEACCTATSVLSYPGKMPETRHLLASQTQRQRRATRDLPGAPMSDAPKKGRDTASFFNSCCGQDSSQSFFPVVLQS